MGRRRDESSLVLSGFITSCSDGDRPHFKSFQNVRTKERKNSGCN